ncbi:MAG: hypothetical protein ACRDO7_15145 [Nocardioidaceae bacterium]
MSSPDRGCLRVVRAAAIAFCVVGLSLVAHLLAGGVRPGVVTLAFAVAVVAAYAGALTRDRLGMAQLVTVLGAGQVLLHSVFMLGSGHHGGGAGMVAAHLVATIVIALALAHGERAVWRLWCWLRPRLMLPSLQRDEQPQRVVRLSDTAAARVQVTWVGTSVMWRGPPAPRTPPTP